MSKKTWSSSEAKAQLDAIIHAAAKGEPQRIRSADGQEVIVISKRYFDETTPKLKMALLTGEKPGQAGDALDDTLKGSQKKSR